MNESRQLAKFVSELKYEHLPPEVIAKAKDIVLDQVGIMMGTATLPWSKVIYDYVNDWGTCKPESSIVHYGDRTKLENAAFANSSFGHGFEMDDHYLPGQSHPGCIVVPSALAVAERQNASGKQMILGVVAGYEVMGRINKAIVPSCSMRGFHAPTSISGPFAAAAVAGKMLGFDPELMVNALSIAGSHAAGTMEYDHSGGSVKRMHAGMASHGGLRAALIAQKGLTGPPTILEGHHGFCHAFADQYNLNEITDNLGKDFRVTLGSAFKAYASCGAMHSGIDAVRKLVAENQFSVKDIAEITYGTNRQSISHIGAVYEPTDITSAQFSAPIGVALTLLKGSNGFEVYNEKNIHDPEIIALAKKVKMVIDKQVDSEFPATRGSRIIIKLKDGKTLEAKVDYSKGTPQNPMTRVEFEGKFRGMASVNADKDRVEEILKTVKKLDELKSVSTLVKMMCS